MPSSKPRTRLEHILEQPWALYPQTLSRIVAWARDGGQTTQVPPGIVALDGMHDGAVRAGSVAIIPVYGVIEQHSDWFMEMFGGVSVDGLRESLRAALADPDVMAVVLDVDSPGGTVAGVTELAAEIRAARGGAKPIVVNANALAASAAYWLASQADEVVATPSAQVGSIGVYAVHEDISRMLDEAGVTVTLVSAGPHKTEGNMFEPLSDEARADIQERVDATYTTFLADVAAGRRVAVSQVEMDFGGGRVFGAKKALAAGMIDRIETLGETIQRLGRPAGRRRATGAAAAAADPEHRAEEVDAIDEAPTDDLPPFGDRLAAFVTDADALVGHASERARLRAKEGRPAFSTTTERSLRSIRGAIDTLLEPDEPAAGAAPPDPVEPAPAASPAPPSASPPPVRFQSRDDWLHFLETHG
jgi:signal peptide peptidase SppA